MTMGIGKIGENYKMPSRKLKWYLESVLGDFKYHEEHVRISCRPSLYFTKEENYISEKSFSTKEDEVIVFTFYEDINKIEEIETYLGYATEENRKSCVFNLTLYDACGNLMERWTLSDAYVSKIKNNDVGDLEFMIVDVVYNNCKWESLLPSHLSKHEFVK